MIDVFIPYYGDPGHLREAVRSVRAQTCPDWRLVILDDNPRDAGREAELTAWLAGFGDERITYEHNEGHLGVSGAFQRCAERAVAPFVTILGCDDLLHPRYVELALKGHRTLGEPDAVQPRVKVVDDRGEPARPLADRVKAILEPRGRGVRVLTGERLATSLLRGAWHYFPAICWNRETLRRHGFRQGHETTPDLVLLLEIALAGGTLALLDEVAFSYRRHPASASSVSARDVSRFEEECAVLDEFAERCGARGWRGARRAARLRLTSRAHALLEAIAACRGGRGAVARRLAGIAVRREALPSPGTSPGTSAGTNADTRDPGYARRLRRSTTGWKRALRLQAPYEWNLRRHRLGRTLDIGCGTGRNLRILPPGSLGVDHNAHSVRIARSAGLSAVTVDEWRDAECPPFESLLLAHLLEHMDRSSARALLEDHLRFLVPGGRVMLICPQERGFASDPTHVEYLSAADLCALAGECGLSVQSTRSFPFPAWVGRFFYANETVVLAAKPATATPVSSGT